MASLLRVKIRWSGYQGGPGYSILHFRDFTSNVGSEGQVAGAVAKTDAFINAVRFAVPPAVTLQTVSDVEELEDTTGELTNVYQATVAAATAGQASSAVGFAAAVGAVVNWRTGGVRNGRRVRGKTFLVPLSSASFENNGTLATATMNGLNTAATALINPVGDGDFGVYARPSAPGATDGQWFVATAHNIPDMGAVLRSRRD
jgi:hypothetical protein